MQQLIPALAFLMLLVASAFALRGLMRSWLARGSQASAARDSSPQRRASQRATAREHSYSAAYRDTERFGPSGHRGGSHWDPFRPRRRAADESTVYRGRPREASAGPPSWDPYAEEQSRRHRVRAARHRRLGTSLPDYYRLLGVERTASDVEIERAYRKRAAEIHPDRFYHDPERRAQAEEEMRQLNEAMRLLRDPLRRARYDSRL